MLKLLFLNSQAVLTAGMCGSSSVGRMRHLGCCGRRFESCLFDNRTILTAAARTNKLLRETPELHRWLNEEP